MNQAKIVPCEKRPAIHMEVDGCSISVFFIPREESNALEDIKRMILSGLSSLKK